MEKVKNSKRVSGSTVAIVVLTILLIAAISIGVALAYFSGNSTVAGTITLGDPVNISITQGGATVSSLTFDGTALPGTVYKQAIGVLAPNNMTTALMRAKITISNDGSASTPVEATTASNWTKNGSDEYYYYYGTVSANDSIDFVTAITVPTSLTNEDANKVFVVNIVVETIQQANNAANAVWTTAPQEWLNTYSPVASSINLAPSEDNRINTENFASEQSLIDSQTQILNESNKIYTESLIGDKL